MKHVAIAHPNTLLKKALINEIEASTNFKVCITANNGCELIQKINHSDIMPDICLFDVIMPVQSGYATADYLKKSWPSIKTIVLTELTHPLAFILMLQYRIDAYTICSPLSQPIIEIIDLVDEGMGYYPDDLLDAMEKIAKRNKLKNGLPLISKREHQIFQFCVKNITCKEIAQSMQVSVRTVETHFKRIYNKLNIRTRGELAQLVQHIGYSSLI